MGSLPPKVWAVTKSSINGSLHTGIDSQLMEPPRSAWSEKNAAMLSYSSSQFAIERSLRASLNKWNDHQSSYIQCYHSQLSQQQSCQEEKCSGTV